MVDMEFCEKCGTRTLYTSESKGLLCCPTCGHELKPSHERPLETLYDAERPVPPPVIVLDRQVLDLKTLPIINASCEKCGGNRAETWAVAAGSEDTSSITFYRCVLCGHTWRETD